LARRCAGVGAIALAALLGVALGCQSARTHDAGQALTEEEALDLAVSLANEECMRQFFHSPFLASDYPIVFRDERWWWGRLDVGGRGGFSSEVSFDAHGRDRRVRVFLSTDQIEPQRQNE
jgi:hypothetical protein